MIAASYSVDIKFGLITTLVIVLHEIPQEIGDFGVLVYGGFSKFKALACNFFIALTCVAGTVIGFPLASSLPKFTAFLLPIVAGGFLYIAACDLIPELHKQPDLRKSISSIAAFLCGIGFIMLAKMLPGH